VLNKKMMFKRNRKAQTANILNLIVAIVLIVAAALPVTLDVIANVSLSGTTKTVVDLVPLFLGIGALVLVARSVIGGGA
jgi:hypothetical protein|tara:strand:+ start:369 stop:605 length:237 start_codon:yes stop_codon:yes gene_type:complete